MLEVIADDRDAVYDTKNGGVSEFQGQRIFEFFPARHAITGKTTTFGT